MNQSKVNYKCGPQFWMFNQYHLTFWWKLQDNYVLTFQYHASCQTTPRNTENGFNLAREHTLCNLTLEWMCNGISIMSMILNKAHIIKKQLKSHYHYTVNTSFIVWIMALCLQNITNWCLRGWWDAFKILQHKGFYYYKSIPSITYGFMPSDS